MNNNNKNLIKIKIQDKKKQIYTIQSNKMKIKYGKKN